MKYGWLTTLLAACSLGEVVRQDVRAPEHIVMQNMSSLLTSSTPSTRVSAAVQYDGALLTGRPFMLFLRFDDYATSFYADGQGRASPVGTYRVEWKILAPGGHRNILLSPLASFSGVKVNYHFVALQRDLQARKTEELPTEALIYLEARSPAPPHLPGGEYRVEARVTDGEPGNPQVLHEFSRTVKVVPPLRWRNGAKMFFRLHSDGNTFALGDEAEREAVGLNGVVSYAVDLTAAPLQRFVTLWGWRLEDAEGKTLRLEKASPSVPDLEFVALSALPSASPPTLSSSTSSHPAESTAMTVKLSLANPLIEASLHLIDDYGQSVNMILRLLLS